MELTCLAVVIGFIVNHKEVVGYSLCINLSYEGLWRTILEKDLCRRCAKQYTCNIYEIL